jgi:putative hydrolase of HD superfamily
MTGAERMRALLRELGRLKDVLRSGRTAAGRRESVAEHSWRVAVMALLTAEAAGADPLRAVGLALVHDLGEALGGDVPAPEQRPGDDRTARERADLDRLLEAAPAAARARLAALWEEAAAGETAAARLVKALDRLETVATHVEGAQAPGFDWRFNLGYGRDLTDAVPQVRAIRALVDAETRARLRPPPASGRSTS